MTDEVKISRRHALVVIIAAGACAPKVAPDPMIEAIRAYRDNLEAQPSAWANGGSWHTRHVALDEALAVTKPTTRPGAIAALDAVLHDRSRDLVAEWHIPAMASAIALIKQERGVEVT